jgi:hypothetical protein
MAFFDGVGRDPPWWFVQLRLCEMWHIKPWEWDELSERPGVLRWIIRQLEVWKLEAERANKNR